jgi:hypothetical protein
LKPISLVDRVVGVVMSIVVGSVFGFLFIDSGLTVIGVVIAALCGVLAMFSIFATAETMEKYLGWARNFS